MQTAQTIAQIIAQAVTGSHAVAELRMGAGVLAQAGTLYLRHFSGPACVIADENTWAAAGPLTMAALTAAGIATRSHIFPARPRLKPSLDLSQTIRDILAQDHATPIVIGSGVLNDLVKHAAFELNRPYLCIATAASMDGYTSAGAPLVVAGFKKTIACRPAKVVLADLDVIAAAPPAMTAWGYGDLAGKVPAGADWILADALGIESMDPAVWPMVQGDLRVWLDQSGAIAAGDHDAIAGLFGGLALVGLAMERHGSSRPASGADHQIAHLWEMEDLHHQGERVSHGGCVAVGTMMMLHLWEWLFEQDLTGLTARHWDMTHKAALIDQAFGPGELARRAVDETALKHLSPPEFQARVARFLDQWPVMRPKLAAQVMPAAQMAQALHRAGAPFAASDIGLTRAHLRRSILNARFIRSRYTLLDLLDELGLLDRAVDAILDRAL